MFVSGFHQQAQPRCQSGRFQKHVGDFDGRSIWFHQNSPWFPTIPIGAFSPKSSATGKCPRPAFGNEFSRSSGRLGRTEEGDRRRREETQTSPSPASVSAVATTAYSSTNRTRTPSRSPPFATAAKPTADLCQRHKNADSDYFPWSYLG
jgi:hypothetical protein